MNSFWLIPLVALSIASILGGIAIEHKLNVVLPNAEIELYELKQMSCTEIKAKNAVGGYSIPANGSFARDKVDACLEIETAIKENERKKMAKLLADPNSRESLEKRLAAAIELREEFRKQQLDYSQELESIQGNLTNFDMETNEVTQKMIELGYSQKVNGCAEIIVNENSRIVVCD